jgi:hypothetical protein
MVLREGLVSRITAKSTALTASTFGLHRIIVDTDAEIDEYGVLFPLVH